MQVTPSDDLSMAQKRAILSDIANLQHREGCGLLEACLQLRLSLNDVRRWRKEVGAEQDRRAMRKALDLYHNGGLPLRTAAQRSCIAERDLVRALKARGRRPSSTPHVGIHNRGFSPASY